MMGKVLTLLHRFSQYFASIKMSDKILVLVCVASYTWLSFTKSLTLFVIELVSCIVYFTKN